jgi:hypothetical protein
MYTIYGEDSVVHELIIPYLCTVSAEICSWTKPNITIRAITILTTTSFTLYGTQQSISMASDFIVVGI